jgi:hypothetical protein
MPRLIDVAADLPPIDLPDLIDALAADPIDHRDEDAFAALAPLLGRLSRNRRFLGDLAIAELEARCAGQVAGNHYGPPVLMLHSGHGDWFLRANIWPAAGDSVMTASGPDPFLYGAAHDHNFSFLTVGHFGPGYWSDYWEYDHAAVLGAVGEAVALVPAGRHRLEEGRVMLYRAHRDVHSQHPPDALSVTINIMESTVRQPWLDQYRFDTDAGRIAGFMNPLAATTLLPLVAHLGGPAGAALLAETARRHPSDRLRAAAIAAAASATDDLDMRAGILDAGTAAPRAAVAAMCRQRLDLLTRQRDWIERPPPRG